MRKLFSCLFLLLLFSNSKAGMEADPALMSLMAHELEYHDSDSLKWDIDAWYGRDLHKFWLKSEGEYEDGETEEAELQFLYNRAVTTYWDIQLGWRTDIRPEPDRQWLVMGLQGLAPYFFEVDAAIFIGESGRVAGRIELEYELLLTQRLVFTPELEVNIYSEDDPALALGSGFSDIEAGVRLRYEVHRKFAPYVGFNWNRKFGETADLERVMGEDTTDMQFVAGIRAWF